jgi:Putative type VII ESX secretion system translocon, EccE
VSDQRLTYRFGPLERRGILGAVRAGQALLLALGGVGAIAALDLSPTAGGGFAAVLVFAALSVLAFAPFGRRTADEWAPVAASFAVRRLRRRDRFASAAPVSGTVASRLGGRGIHLGTATADPPPCLRGTALLERPYRERTIGVLSEARGRRLTAVLAARVVAFSLLDPDAQERRLARWGLVLSGAAATSIRRIQWVERTAPAQGDELVRWLHAERDPEVPLRGTPMIDSYLELIGTTAKVTQEHEILVAVQVDAGRVRARGEDPTMRALLEQTERVAQGLEAAEVSVLGALTPSQLARALRTAFDPFARGELAALETVDPGRERFPASSAWPLGTHERWDHYVCDGALHATHWIGGWPRVDVSPLFMDALLGRSSAVRTVAVTIEPIPPERSTRLVEAAVTRDRADRELRRRFGQSETARQRQAGEATARREAELAAGHSEVRLTGFVTVTGRDPDDLRRACSEVHEHAARARIELHRMYGQQAQAFTFTLPLCRGLR